MIALNYKKYNLSNEDYIVGSFQRDTEGHDLHSPKLSKGPDLFIYSQDGKKMYKIQVKSLSKLSPVNPGSMDSWLMNDFVIICTYAGLNKLLNDFPEKQLEYQFEICEKPIVSLPNSFHKKSVVVMDGPFMCVDPFGNSGNFVLGNVVHAIHHSNVGKTPIVPKEFNDLLNNGIISEPPITNFDLFIESGKTFLLQ